MQTRQKDELLAYTESGRTWVHKPKILNLPSKFWPDCPFVLDINYPIQYRLTKHFLEGIKDHGFLTIDMGGRNYGVNESVRIKCQDILDWLEVNHKEKE